MKFVNTFDFHSNHRNLTVDEYYKFKRIELSNEINKKKIVYFDTKFWVLLRDSVLFPKKNSFATELLNLSVFLSENGVCIFPISEDVFMEVIKQTDSTTLKTTIQLIDKLSDGITLISFDERVKLEILHFWRLITGKTVYEIKEFIWSKLAYVLGFYTFSDPNFDIEINLLLNKVFVDQMWTITLLQMIDNIQKSGGVKHHLKSLNIDKLNVDKHNHMHEAKSFQQMFMNEVAGIIDAYKADLGEMMVFLFEEETGKNLSGDEIKEHRDETIRLTGNAIYNLFRLNKVGKAMPTIRISSALYAAVRWDIKQKFQEHDYHDFRHASAALPYCDYFFTEKRLAHLVTQKLLAFDRLYNCEVESTINGAIILLKILYPNYCENQPVGPISVA